MNQKKKQGIDKSIAATAPLFNVNRNQKEPTNLVLKEPSAVVATLRNLHRTLDESRFTILIELITFLKGLETEPAEYALRRLDTFFCTGLLGLIVDLLIDKKSYPAIHGTNVIYLTPIPCAFADVLTPPIQYIDVSYATLLLSCLHGLVALTVSHKCGLRFIERHKVAVVYYLRKLPEFWSFFVGYLIPQGIVDMLDLYREEASDSRDLESSAHLELVHLTIKSSIFSECLQ